MAPHKASQKTSHSPLFVEDELDSMEVDLDMAGPTKSKVECICPNCGKKHIMNIRWIGRGVPRKFCQSCRDRETSSDFDI